METAVEKAEKEISNQAVLIFRSTKEAKLAYLCKICAMALGGEWPKHHVATINPGTCDICQQAKAIAYRCDWQLNEDGKRYNVSRLE